MCIRSRILLCLLFCFVSQLAAAQVEENPWLKIQLKDGSTLIGRQVELTAQTLVLESEGLGKINIDRQQIASIDRITASDAAAGLYSPNVSDTRLLIAPSAYSLRRGKGYYQNLLLGINRAGFGVTDHFSVDIGLELFTFLTLANVGEDISFPGFFLQPKLTFPVVENKVNVGGGALLFNFPFSDSFIDFAGLYGLFTVGPRHSFLNLGLGFGIAGDESSAAPLLTLSGQLRVSPGFALVTDNWIVPSAGSGGGLITLGGRVLGDRLHWDFGLGVIVGDGGVFLIPVPLVGVTVPFGQKS